MNYIRKLLSRRISNYNMEQPVTKKSLRFEEIDLNDSRLHQRAARSAMQLVESPTSYKRSVEILKKLIVTPGISAKIQNQVFSGLEHATTKICFNESKHNNEYDESEWNGLMDFVFEHESVFTEPQLEKLQQWKKKDFTYIIETRKSSVSESQEAPTRLRYAETVLKYRTNRFAVVLERPYDDLNQQAVIRTADCFGIQDIYIVEQEKVKKSIDRQFSSSVTKNLGGFMSVHPFTTTRDCITALRDKGYSIWVTVLTPDAIPIDTPTLELPEKLAIVFGRESDGCSQEIIDEADKKVYIPIYGFAESLNLSVAAGLTMQHLFSKCPEARGNLSLEEKSTLRESWYSHLSRKSDKKRDQIMKWIDTPPEPLEDLRRLEKQHFVSKRIRKRQIETSRPLEVSTPMEIEGVSKKPKAIINDDSPC